MSRINWLDIAAGCFTEDAKEMHVDDIAKHVKQRGLVNELNPEEIAIKLSAALSGNVRRKSSQFARVKNKSGGNKKGYYRIKNSTAPKLIRMDAPKIDTSFTGKAGEHAVLSELLFYGFNASIMAVDQGIDIVASKENKYFHIQVKTANGDDSKPYLTAIRRESFQHASNTFYIIVMRRSQRQRYVNDYLILSSNEIRRYIKSGELKDGFTISLRITLDNKGRFFLNGLKANMDVTHCINDFDSIC